MASQRAIAGTVYLAVNGVQYALQGNWKIQPNNIQRKSAEGQSGSLGFTQKWLTPSFKGDISDYGGLSVQALQNITNETITAELVNGKNYVLFNAFCDPEAEIDTETGKIPTSFYGVGGCQELTA